jgi:hypothetical protein
VKAAAKDAPFRLWAETNRDEKDPGMKVSQAMTRDAYIVSKSDDFRVRHLPVVNVPSACRHFVDWKLVD